MSSDTPQPTPGDDSRRVDYGVLAVMGIVVVLLIGAAIVGVVMLSGRFASAEEEPPEPDEQASNVEPLPVGTPAAGADNNPSYQQQVAAMHPRYRPGPFVQTVGLLPTGMSSLRRMAASNRGGRTVDTPWIVAGAELHAGTAPLRVGAGGPGLRLGPRENAGQPLMVIPGSPANVQIVASPGSGSQGAVQGLLIRFRDYPGYFFLPAVVDSELGQIRVAGVDQADLQFGIDAPVYPNGTPLDPGKELEAVLEIAAVDLDGRTSAFVERRLRVLPVGTGDVEVTVRMTEATDLDLYVVDPTGVVVYYGNTNSFSDGQLDLDANAGCGSNMGVNNEHIYWPRGRAPAGTYQVRVSNFESCIQNRRVDYTVTVRNCGETAVFSGSFEGPGDSRNCTEDPGAQRGWCQQVVSFDVTPCSPQ
ncbi:MAG: hypothetical protein AAGE52_15730 [Myxococcota bacterium]